LKYLIIVVIKVETIFIEKKKRNQNFQQYFFFISAINKSLILYQLRNNLLIYYISNISFFIKKLFFYNKIAYLQLTSFYTNTTNYLLFKLSKNYNTLDKYYKLYVFSGILKIKLFCKIKKDILQTISLTFLKI
jgi:hypothetical protein